MKTQFNIKFYKLLVISLLFFLWNMKEKLQAQCPDFISLDYTIDYETGEAIFTLSAVNADSVFIYFGDDTNMGMTFSNSITVNHTYTFDSKYNSYYYVIAYFYKLNCTPVYTTAIIEFQNKNCQIFPYFNPIETQRKGFFEIYTNNYSENNIQVSLQYKGSTLDTFSLTYYSSSYTTDTFNFSKAGSDTVIFISDGDYCSSIDTFVFYVYGESCPFTQLSTSNDANIYTFTVNNANEGSIFYWFYNLYTENDYIYSSDTTYEPSITVNIPLDSKLNLTVQTYDSINECSSWNDKTIYTGKQICYAEFYINKSIYDTSSRTIFITNLSANVEGNTYSWNFGDGNTATGFDPEYHIYSSDGVYTVKLTITSENCSQTYSQKVTIGNTTCMAGFTYHIEGQEVAFTDTSVSDFVYWYFGDGNWSYDINPVHTYSSPGYYDVYQYVSLNNFEDYCYDEIIKTIAVGDVSNLVKAYFTYESESENSFTFIDNSTGNITSYYWTFGDGTTASTQNVDKVYTQPGTYYVCLTIKGNTGNVSQYCDYILVTDEFACNLMAKYNYKPNKIQSKLIEFTNLSQGSGEYYWDFGDGSFSTEHSPSHNYNKNGYYWVSLSIYNEEGCIDTYYDWVQVGTVDCKAEFSYAVEVSTLTVTFNNMSKAGDDASYYWIFDDGDYSYDANPIKTFSTSGKHYVGLMVYDINTMCYDYIEQYVQVGDIDCSAEFTHFIDTSTNTLYCYNKSLGSSTYLFWYFGDGSYSFENNPSHRFAAPGFYTIGLATYDENNGCIDYYEKIIQITGAGNDCVADFTYFINSDDNSVNFYNNSYGNIVKYVWNFGNGITSTEANPTTSYNVGGYYNVCLTVVNDMGYGDITCKEIKVSASVSNDCKANFIFVIDSITSTVKFLSKSTGNPTSFEWDFGDGQYSSGSDKVSHQYSNPDYYLVGLKISNNSGCMSYAYELINIGMPEVLKAAFAYKENENFKKAGGYPVDFIGAGLGDEARIKWTFGDGSIDTTSTTPTHVYAQPGTYEVCYEISDPITGTSDKYCQTITVTGTKVQPIQNIPFSIYPVPFNNELYLSISLKQTGNVKIIVSDLAGRLVTVLFNKRVQAGNDRLQLNTSSIKAGSYILTINTPEGNFKQLVIKR